MKTQNQDKATANVYVRDFCGRPEINFAYKGGASWKVGDGVKNGRIRTEMDGSFYCIFSETSLAGIGEKRDVTKEVFISIPAKAFAEMKKLDAEHAALVECEKTLRCIFDNAAMMNAAEPSRVWAAIEKGAGATLEKLDAIRKQALPVS